VALLLLTAANVTAARATTR